MHTLLRSPSSAWLRLAMLLTALTAVMGSPALLSSCTPGTGGDGDGDGDGDAGDGDTGDGDGDSGDGDTGGPVDLGCASDEACGAGQVCDLATGDCIAGQDCSANPTICAFCADPGSQCNTGTAPTYCDEDAGVCRRSKATCEACTDDAECGTGANFPNQCIGGYCAEGCGACPPGFSCSGEGGCVPVETAGACATAIPCRNGETCPDGQRCSELGVCLALCETDAECPAGMICSLDPGPLNQQCVNGCPEGQTVMSGGDTLICHADGHFGYMCPDVACPDGFECTPQGFCDTAGCASSQDCPLVRTYCDTTTGECVDGCQVDTDCGAFEECGEDMQCRAGGCRGKDVSCNLGQWCCGTEYYEENACPADVEVGTCFLTPEPWCQRCEDNDGCAGIDHFGQPSNCYELTQQDENGNDVSLGKYCSVGCESNADCPRGLQCIDLPTEEEGVMIKGCLGAICQAIADARDQAP